MEERKRIPCEVYSRIVGYFRPIRNWNKGKRREFMDRKVYNLSKEQLHKVAVNADQRANKDLAH